MERFQSRSLDRAVEVIRLGQCAQVAGVISAEYDADDSVMAYSAIDLAPFGFSNRDVILADELGFKGVPVGLLAMDLATGELWEIYRGTRVIHKGPNEWKVDAKFMLVPCPFIAGARSEQGFTSTEETFRLLSGRRFPPIAGAGGHSLAAAWALERAAKYRLKLISFAGPRVFDRAGSAAALELIPDFIRLVNKPDIVPDLPETVWPFFEYLHVGAADQFDSTAKIKAVLDPDPIRNLALKAAAFHNIHTYWNAIDPVHPILPEYAA